MLNRFYESYDDQICCEIKKRALQGGHKHRRPGNFQNLRNCQNLREYSVTFEFLRKTWKTKGKCQICQMTTNETVFQRTLLLKFAEGKNWKCSRNLKENSGSLVSQKCGHSAVSSPLHTLCGCEILKMLWLCYQNVALVNSWSTLLTNIKQPSVCNIVNALSDIMNIHTEISRKSVLTEKSKKVTS